ncbi:hypothetical protein COT97_03860 [Candidatus Falkowbacteria bacterium CG10_big_fil_rev_8_21_14_0_10_39_11]|uniref:Uncharacterized protein n=1 Tax=Candidatus Falkowbacteria bacterium CG10_big_fil_rev_8_21_14_0_10_39_11 TaxID=1974565 RepID=A0A2H0V699_9BACT|nr:MAG: hypothetical protein COT97_03860 [Candidatus Falkowbacteria bacterium CG10_big_fil_rev_8_21_14_0_10_39_11]
MLNKKIRIPLYILYSLVFIIFPTFFISYAFYQDYNIPQWTVYFKNTISFAFFFFFISTFLLSSVIFPQTLNKVIALFVPVVINLALIYYTYTGYNQWDLFTVQAATTYCGLLIGYTALLFVVPWDIFLKKKANTLRTFKQKLKYLFKDEPTSLIGVAALLLPIIYGVYMFMAGLSLVDEVYSALTQSGISGWMIYLLTILNISVFHFVAAKDLDNESFEHKN